MKKFWGLLILLLTSLSVEARDLTDLRTFGEPSPIQLYLFSSPDCPHCRDFHKTIFPELLKRYVDTKKIQIFIVDMAYNKASLDAVQLMRCLPEDKSARMMTWLYENQGKWVSNRNYQNVLSFHAAGLGMSSKDFYACLNNEELRSAIKDQRDNLSNLYGIHAWPKLALRKGRSVKVYTGTDKKAILAGLERDFKDFTEDKNTHQLIWK